jgi:hypothetical protein
LQGTVDLRLRDLREMAMLLLLLPLLAVAAVAVRLRRADCREADRRHTRV